MDKRKSNGAGKLPVFKAVCVILLGWALLPAPAAADPVIEDERGVYLGLAFAGSSLHAETNKEDSLFIKDDGGGIGFDLGYRFNRTFSLELSLSVSAHKTSVQSLSAAISSLKIFGYYRFLPKSPFRPYLKGGIGGYALRLEAGQVSATIEGGGIAVGAGFRFFFTPHFSFGVDLTHGIIQYDKGQLDIGEFHVGATIDEEGAQTNMGVIFAYGF